MTTTSLNIFLTVCCLAILSEYGAKAHNTGTFWHISDHHLDPYYMEQASDPTQVCPSSYGVPVENPGPWGNYRCDSPWALINSSVFAMKNFKGDPDFIIWTGDDTLHTGDQEKYLGKQLVLEIIGNITMLIKEVFPETKVYAAMGNHDYHPKSQIPPGKSEILSGIADMWKDWMKNDSWLVFSDNGYYTETFGPQNKHRLISLNSNYWYTSNKVVDGTGDPGGQFHWLETTLQTAKEQSQQVFIIGHVPPGYFELVDYKYWFYPAYNERFNGIVRSYSDVIFGQFFGHHHSDTFRLFKDSNGDVVSSMLLTPGVTPWMTTLPGAKDGANNPGIRLYEYDKDSLALKDFTQYYLDLGLVTADTPVSELWNVEYKATEAYGISDVSTSSLDQLARSMRDGCERSSCPPVFDKFFLHNSVSYNRAKCDVTCQRDQLCAVTEVEIEGHTNCNSTWGSSAIKITYTVLPTIVVSLGALLYPLLINILM